jgi:hypothetical protein
MNMLPLAEPFSPHPNFDDAINRAICQSEIEGGVSLDELPLGALLDVQTSNTLYRIENRGDGEVFISGHPEICPTPVLVSFHGSTWGTPMLKLRFIGRDMKMEFFHPLKGLVRTSRVQDIMELTAVGSTRTALIRKTS